MSIRAIRGPRPVPTLSVKRPSGRIAARFHGMAPAPPGLQCRRGLGPPERVGAPPTVFRHRRDRALVLARCKLPTWYDYEDGTVASSWLSAGTYDLAPGRAGCGAAGSPTQPGARLCSSHSEIPVRLPVGVGRARVVCSMKTSPSKSRLRTNGCVHCDSVHLSENIAPTQYIRCVACSHCDNDLSSDGRRRSTTNLAIPVRARYQSTVLSGAGPRRNSWTRGFPCPATCA